MSLLPGHEGRVRLRYGKWPDNEAEVCCLIATKKVQHVAAGLVFGIEGHSNRIRRDFTADASRLNARWCGDITYIRTWEGWLFLATVIDIASRRVVGYAMADHLRTSLVADALSNAVAAFAGLADDYQVVLSLGRTGQCWDNALAESFFASLKGELIDIRSWATRAAARRAIVEYIGWYNGTRLHSTLGYRSPAQFETSTEKEDLGQVA